MVQLCLCGNSHTNLRVPFYQGLSLPPFQVLSANQPTNHISNRESFTKLNMDMTLCLAPNTATISTVWLVHSINGKTSIPRISTSTF
jgi:hypothetical protein